MHGVQNLQWEEEQQVIPAGTAQSQYRRATGLTAVFDSHQSQDIFLYGAQTGSGAHPAYPKHIWGPLPEGNAAGGEKGATHLYPVAR
jgi:hypothetical protein